MQQYIVDIVTYIGHTNSVLQPQNIYADTNMQALCDVCFVFSSVHPYTLNMLHFCEVFRI